MITFAIPFPSIDPVAFSIGPVDVRWYGLAYMAGLLLGWLYVRRLVARSGLWGGRSPMTADQADSLLLWVTLGVVAGGRLGFGLFYEPTYFIEHPTEIFALWHGGMAFHGGVLGVILAVWWFTSRQRISVLSVGDAVAAAVPIGLFFGRIANFINGEVYGRPSSVAWAMVFPEGGPEPRHPSQLYEAALEGIALFALLYVLIHRRGALARPGLVSGALLAGYAVARVFCEFFREADPNWYFDLRPLTSGMAYSLPMLAFGSYLVWRARRRPATDGDPGKTA